MDNFDRGRVYTYIGEDSAAVDELRAAIALNPGFALRSGLRTAYGYQCAYDPMMMSEIWSVVPPIPGVIAGPAISGAEQTRITSSPEANF